MPNKKDLSHLMPSNDFFTKWLTWQPLVYRVVLDHIREYPLHDAPGFGSVDDVVGSIRETMHRLAIFARWDPAIQSELKYVGNQVLSIMQHMWQDNCRVNKRIAISISTLGGLAEDDKDPMSIVDNAINHDPNLSWSYGLGATDDTASERMVITALENAIKDMPSKRKDLALKAMALIKKSPTLAAAPTTTALAAALSVEDSTATIVRDILRAAAAEVLA